MRRERQQSPTDEPLPSPLTSRNLRPRSEAKSLRSRSGSRGGSARPSRPSSSLSNSSLMPPIAGHSRAGIKREREEEEEQEEPSSGARGKRVRATSIGEEVEEDQEEEDELQDELEAEEIQAGVAPSSQSNPDAVKVQDHHPTTSPSSSLRPEAQAKPDPNPSQPRSPVSSPSLAKLLHPVDAEPTMSVVNPSSIASSAPIEFSIASSSKTKLPSPSTPRAVEPAPEPLSAYSCPICFFPPTNATLTPCGHVCCGSCLFTAVKTMTQRGQGAMRLEASVARCPVCRAQIPGWDGRGGGVIGLKVRAVFSL
ncbi:hypothetical protein C8F04DRAFT_1046777 [Mycena alexandri]|uniref:RING-type domain-containing protein n=1 Tax=Mycena alexandri TaxID=1745969 RepID=A0AAD6SDU9_9AGAR|nr:hypothetical protein C8F04DRAFT_1046777 [Mycena alexandri]